MGHSPFNHDSGNENAASLAMAERFAAEVAARKAHEAKARLEELGLATTAHDVEIPLPDHLQAWGLMTPR